MEIKGHIYSLVAGILSGAAIGAVSHFRERKAAEPSLLDKVRELERKIYQDGEDRALLLAKVKQDAKLAAAIDVKHK